MSRRKRQLSGVIAAAAVLAGGCGGSSKSSSHSSSSTAANSPPAGVRKACVDIQTGLTKSARDTHSGAGVNTLKADLAQVQHAFDALRPFIRSDLHGPFNLAEGEYTSSVQSLIYQQSGRSQEAQKQARLALLLRQRINASRVDPFGVCRQASVTR